MFDYAVSCWTEIQTHIKINSETGIADDGALRYQEYLPADSVLYAIFHYSGRDMCEIDDMDKNGELGKLIQDMQAERIKQYIEETACDFIQIGGAALAFKLLSANDIVADKPKSIVWEVESATSDIFPDLFDALGGPGNLIQEELSQATILILNGVSYPHTALKTLSAPSR